MFSTIISTRPAAMFHSAFGSGFAGLGFMFGTLTPVVSIVHVVFYSIKSAFDSTCFCISLMMIRTRVSTMSRVSPST